MIPAVSLMLCLSLLSVTSGLEVDPVAVKAEPATPVVAAQAAHEAGPMTPAADAGAVAPPPPTPVGKMEFTPAAATPAPADFAGIFHLNDPEAPPIDPKSHGWLDAFKRAKDADMMVFPEIDLKKSFKLPSNPPAPSAETTEKLRKIISKLSKGGKKSLFSNGMEGVDLLYSFAASKGPYPVEIGMSRGDMKVMSPTIMPELDLEETALDKGIKNVASLWKKFKFKQISLKSDTKEDDPTAIEALNAYNRYRIEAKKSLYTAKLINQEKKAKLHVIINWLNTPFINRKSSK